MKKISFIFFFLTLCVSLSGFSQTNPITDFYAGKWEIKAAAPPMGEVTFRTNLVRKDGKLTGELVNPTDATQTSRPITRVEEKVDNLVLYFESSQAGEMQSISRKWMMIP